MTNLKHRFLKFTHTHGLERMYCCFQLSSTFRNALLQSSCSKWFVAVQGIFSTHGKHKISTMKRHIESQEMLSKEV